MSLWKLATLSVAGFVGYRIWDRSKEKGQAAFASGQGSRSNDTKIRNSGPDAMRDGAKRPWTKEDEQSDQSFPASDPPANY